MLKGTGKTQKTVTSRKEATEADTEIQEGEGLRTAHKDSDTTAPSKRLQLTKAVAGASLAKDHNNGTAETQREAAGAEKVKELEEGSKQKGPPRVRAPGKPQQQRPPGMKEQKIGTAGVESDPEAPATEAFRSKGRLERDISRSFHNGGLRDQGKKKLGQ